MLEDTGWNTEHLTIEIELNVKVCAGRQRGDSHSLQVPGGGGGHPCSPKLGGAPGISDGERRDRDYLLSSGRLPCSCAGDLWPSQSEERE